MTNRAQFVSGGAALSDPWMFDLLSETVQEVFAEGAARRLSHIEVYNPGTAVGFVKLMWSVRRYSLTFAGTATNGNYDLVVDHPSLRAGGVATPTTARVTRAAGTPSTNADLAAAMETEIETNEVATLGSLIVSANDTSNVNTLVTARGVHDLTLTTAAPAPGTLTVTDALPSLTADLADMTFGIPAGARALIPLGITPRRLWIAATTESGLGATAPDADMLATLFLG